MMLYEERDLPAVQGRYWPATLLTHADLCWGISMKTGNDVGNVNKTWQQQLKRCLIHRLSVHNYYRMRKQEIRWGGGDENREL